MKNASLLVMLVTLGVMAWVVSATPAQAVPYHAVLTTMQDEPAQPALQQDEPAQPSAQEAEAQTFVGKIMNHEGKYSLQGEDGKTYQLDDQDKAKEFDGKKVTVTGSLDEQDMTIKVSEIEEAEA